MAKLSNEVVVAETYISIRGDKFANNRQVQGIMLGDNRTYGDQYSNTDIQCRVALQADLQKRGEETLVNIELIGLDNAMDVLTPGSRMRFLRKGFERQPELEVIDHMPEGLVATRVIQRGKIVRGTPVLLYSPVRYTTENGEAKD